jgi:para-nitrobenzyl esterase
MLLAWLQDSGSAAGREEAQQVLRQLQPSDIAAYMRELPLSALLAPVATARGMYSYPALFRDGIVLPKAPLLEVFRDPAGWNRVPVLAGTNRDEMKLFLALNDRHVKQRFGLLPQPRDPAQYNQLARLHSLQWKASGVDEPLASMAASDPSLPLFAYRFDWDDMRANWLVDLPQLLGAAHALELDFLFGPLISRVVPGVLHDGNREGAAVLGRAMRDYWAGFAYSGRPGTGRSAAHPVWPTWDPERAFTMVLDEEDDGGIRVESLRASTEATKLALAEAEGLSDRMRCALYVDLFLANRGMSEFYDAQEYQRLGCAPLPAWSLVGQSR